MKSFEIREGDGNIGTYRQGTVKAKDAFSALRIASRQGLIHRPWDVTLKSADGDSEHAYLASYVSPIFGDCCRWIAEAHSLSGTIGENFRQTGLTTAPKGDTMQKAIEENRKRKAYYDSCERLLREIRKRVFDYEDSGKGEQSSRIIQKLKKRLAPLWEARVMALFNRNS